MSETTDKDIEKLIKSGQMNNKTKKSKKKKKRLTTSKKSFLLFMFWCFIVQAICLYFAILYQSEMIMTIFATSAVVEPIAIYKFYLDYQKEINLMKMQKNFNPNYDEENYIK